jgi:hypothetical protein
MSSRPGCTAVSWALETHALSSEDTAGALSRGVSLRGVGVGVDDVLGILVRRVALRVLVLAPLERRILFFPRRFGRLGHGYGAIL